MIMLKMLISLMGTIFSPGFVWADSMAPPAIEGLRDVKGPVAFPSAYTWLWWIVILAAMGGVIFWIYSRKNKGMLEPVEPIDSRSCEHEAGLE